jgi:hypothetical protein
LYTPYIPGLFRVGEEVASTELHLQKKKTGDRFKNRQLGGCHVKLSGGQSLVSKLGVYVLMTLSSVMFFYPYVTVYFLSSSLLALRSDVAGKLAGNLVVFRVTDCKVATTDNWTPVLLTLQDKTINTPLSTQNLDFFVSN